MYLIWRQQGIKWSIFPIICPGSGSVCVSRKFREQKESITTILNKDGTANQVQVNTNRPHVYPSKTVLITCIKVRGCNRPTTHLYFSTDIPVFL